MLRNSRILLALVGQAPLLANFIRASSKPLGATAPKTQLKSRILLLYLRFWGILDFLRVKGCLFFGILDFILGNSRIPYYVILGLDPRISFKIPSFIAREQSDRSNL